MPEFSPNHKVPGFSVKNIPYEQLAKKSFCGMKYFHLKIKSKLSRYLTFERGFKSQLGKFFLKRNTVSAWMQPWDFIFCLSFWVRFYLNLTYSHDSIIRPGLIIFKLFKKGLGTVLIIESFDIFWNSSYNRDSTYNFS